MGHLARFLHFLDDLEKKGLAYRSHREAFQLGVTTPPMFIFSFQDGVLVANGSQPQKFVEILREIREADSSDPMTQAAHYLPFLTMVAEKDKVNEDTVVQWLPPHAYAVDNRPDIWITFKDWLVQKGVDLSEFA